MKPIAIITHFIIFLLLSLNNSLLFGQSLSGLGQTIQISTQLHAFVGKPSWLLIIRDLDHDQNIPYLYDFTKGNNYWLAFTYGRNYLIVASTLQFAPYKIHPYRIKKIHNFCHLESMGRIIRGQSIKVRISGKLSANTDSYTCTVIKYPDANVTTSMPGSI